MTWTRERWQEVEAIFHDAAREQPADRAAFLATACGGDASLRTAVERLLAADAGEDELLDRGAIGLLRAPDPLLQQRFGAFRLVERIAEGGMGTVYRAERDGGDFAQTAAIKVLRLGLSSERARDRFARERRTLARLVHPNVGRLLDGGTTEAGVAFIAMEFIDGLPIDRWCDAQRAGVRARLQLFATVCRAVHFAHQNLVVHLDLKPGNILVDAHGVPKLLDFGVAGLVVDAAEGRADATRDGPLTPEYASPEQLRGEPVSTATDVYSLGVVLFLLLTGQRPFAAAGGTAAGIARAVDETDAVRPSAVFATAAAADEQARLRAATAPALARQLRGDLDRIVLKALRREPQRRYSSCQEFADDIDRYLRGFPVTAQQPSLGYRASRFVRRNRVAVGAAALTLLALVAALVATLDMAATARCERDAADAARLRAEREGEHARIEAASSRTFATFLGDTFLSADFVGGAAVKSRLAAVVERRAAQVRRQHDGNPHLRANLLDALGHTAMACDDALADRLLTEALTLRRQTFAGDNLEVALSLGSLGQLRYQQGRYAEAAELLRECYRLHRSCPSEVHTDVALAANDLAAAERALGNRQRARELHAEALALRRGPGGDPVLAAESLNNLANCSDDPATAQELLQQALAIRSEVLGDDDPLTIQSRINLARVRFARGDTAAAVELLDAAATASRSLGALGAEALAQTQATRAMVELRGGDPTAAAAAIDEAIAVDGARLGADHPVLAKHHEVRAAIAAARGDAAGAVAATREVLRIRRATLPPVHRDTASTLCRLGMYLNQQGEPEAARQELASAEAMFAQCAEHSPLDLADVQWNQAASEERLGHDDAAERLLLAAYATNAAEPSRRAALPGLRARLRTFYQRLGRAADAARFEEPGR